MSSHRAYVGIGTNLGDRAANLERAVSALATLGKIVARSSAYRTAPWGFLDQPWFLNAVVLLETRLEPRKLLESLQNAQRSLGRIARERWGPREIDLDLLTYDDRTLDEPGLRLPHPRLHERAFVLVPLAEIDARFAAQRDALHARELAGVVRVERETGLPMAEKQRSAASEHIRRLASFLAEGDVARVRVERAGEEIEIVARPRAARRASGGEEHPGAETNAARVDAIKADIVGIFHLGRPAPAEGETFDGDRELGYVEALGIRTPVHSMGAGQLVAIATADGSAVEYGQPLFLVARPR
jgi:2-amino-4-hydroxy-6-hydroxymethyldihydropteridine diphosphokinase